MALIRSVERGSRNVRPHRTAVDLTYQLLDDAAGRRLLHIATYGSDDRQDIGTTSQSMQFDRDAAEALLRAIAEAFPGLSPR